MKTPSGEPMPDWWWFLGPPQPRVTTKDGGRVPANATTRPQTKGVAWCVVSPTPSTHPKSWLTDASDDKGERMPNLPTLSVAHEVRAIAQDTADNPGCEW